VINERTIVTEDQISAVPEDVDPTATIPDDEPDEPDVDTDLNEAHVVTDPLDGQGADEPQDIMPLDADFPPGVEIDDESIEGAVRIGSAATAWANRVATFRSGYCLSFARQCFSVAPRYGTAAIAWANTRYRHTSTPPAAVPVWWTGGSRGYGHVAFSLGGGSLRSTDYPSRGRVGRVSIGTLNRIWGQRYRGWSEDINGVRVWRPAEASAPTKSLVDASIVAQCATSGAGAPGTSGVVLIQRALMREIPGYTNAGGVGYFGPRTRAAYAKWQQALGFHGADANGIPGYTSLKRLGDKYGFRVVP
jgi:hypothetical protein